MSKSQIYNIKINALDNSPIDLSDFKGKYLLIVNVASKCGFTNQYRDLEKLFQKFKQQLMVIGVPSNQFGGQEPGSQEQIGAFCERNYGVSFLMTEKLKVKGENQHPLYTWLTNKNENGKFTSSVKWNFQKYLVGPDGRLIDVYYSLTTPMSSKITKHIV
ncbi:glutathione peroxidase [Muriicola sp. Z0-33]|uniref:glutathione peroxidase n=1 Tax=Muriicola sp. Z0-33 TaxID=2816957 RepID=UPI002238D45B|nr:glutathione peroxidase [Muriicola sp. Z0-33]MCW5517873.1 glutathione peroxidase [Muriicola sp. Z0-33]